LQTLSQGDDVTFNRVREEFEVRGRDLLGKVTNLVRQGNVTRIIIKDKNGDTFAEFPATVGAAGVFLVPALTVVGALSALVANFRIVIERAQPKAAKAQKSRSLKKV
jgi:hypothetical protein